MESWEIVDLEPELVAVVSGTVAVNAVGDFLRMAFGQVAAAIAEAGAEVTGPPFAHYPVTPAEVVVVEAGFPTSTSVRSEGGVHPSELPGGRAVVVVHRGPYEELERTYAEMIARLETEGLQPRGGFWESYLTDPEAEPDPGRWLTRLACPVEPRP